MKLILLVSLSLLFLGCNHPTSTFTTSDLPDNSFKEECKTAAPTVWRFCKLTSTKSGKTACIGDGHYAIPCEFYDDL